jgi:diadenosine tetraphosphate (Ap4A) HIT family hydrolase
VEPTRKGEEIADCKACQSGDDSYIWVNERWRVRSMDRPTGLPMILILEPRSHLDLGDLPNLLAAELGVMTVRVERAIRSLDNVARVHVNRWGDGAAHLHVWFMARPKGQLQLRGSFLPMWDDILPPVAESQWREDLALVAAWLAEFGGTALAQPPKIEWQAPSRFRVDPEPAVEPETTIEPGQRVDSGSAVEGGPAANPAPTASAGQQTAGTAPQQPAAAHGSPTEAYAANRSAATPPAAAENAQPAARPPAVGNAQPTAAPSGTGTPAANLVPGQGAVRQPAPGGNAGAVPPAQ